MRRLIVLAAVVVLAAVGFAGSGTGQSDAVPEKFVYSLDEDGSPVLSDRTIQDYLDGRDTPHGIFISHEKARLLEFVRYMESFDPNIARFPVEYRDGTPSGDSPVAESYRLEADKFIYRSGEDIHITLTNTGTLDVSCFTMGYCLFGHLLQDPPVKGNSMSVPAEVSKVPPETSVTVPSSTQGHSRISGGTGMHEMTRYPVSIYYMVI